MCTTEYSLLYIITVRTMEIAEIAPIRVTQIESTIDGKGKYPAENALDKDLATHSLIPTENGISWLELKFDDTYLIHKVVIYFRFFTGWYHPDDRCAKNQTTFEACVNENRDINVSVYKSDVFEKSCVYPDITSELTQSDQIYSWLCMAEGDTVKIKKSTETNMELFEVAVTSTRKIAFIIGLICKQVMFK